MSSQESARPDQPKKHTLYAVYDLAVSPITFDVLQFLQCAEIYRRHIGFSRLSIVFVLGPDRQFRRATPKDEAVDIPDKYWRLRHIHMEAAWLLKSCTGVNVFVDRAEAQRLLQNVPDSHIFPPQYKLASPKWIFMVVNVLSLFRRSKISPIVFEATEAALRSVDRWIEHNGLTKPIVSLTLRHSVYEADRNADVGAWNTFARTLRERGFDPVFVPDTDQAAIANTEDYQTEFPHYWPGPVNLELRAALYRRSHICMSDNGAAAFIHHWMPNCHSIIFQPPSKIPGVFRRTQEGQAGIERVLGIKVGEQLPYCSPTQRIAWVDDTYENLLAEFDRLEALIAGAPQPDMVPGADA
ncbi:hypothetical protein [Thalassobaculum sp.]|uniref:hypothetical protein n=1 Tax=Thalassobaculum sp. TaxID=2022740 RepID=UPI0032F08C06